LQACGVAPQHKKGITMAPIDITRIESEARQLRAEEMRRINGLVSARLALYGQLMAATALTGLKAIADVLLPLFSWNPQAASATFQLEPAGAPLLTVPPTVSSSACFIRPLAPP
jgi:hypothetical protein